MANCDAKAADAKDACRENRIIPIRRLANAVTSARQILAYNLKAFRLKNKLSQEGLAYEAGLHRTFVAHVERGARNISIDNIERLAIALGTTAAELLKAPSP